MARPPQEEIDTFIGITGAPEAVAVRKLEEHGGDLNAAVNAHFSEGDRAIAHTPSVPADENDLMDIDDPVDFGSSAPFPLLAAAAARDLNPFTLLNSTIGQSFFNSEGASELPTCAPHVSHPKDVRVIPSEVKDWNGQPGSSRREPIIEDITGSVPAYCPDNFGTVIIEDEDLPISPANHVVDDSGEAYFGRHPAPSVPPVKMTDTNDIEEEMILAAIEASKREVEQSARPHFGVRDGSTSSKREKKLPASEDDDFADVLSLSMKTAEQEQTLLEVGGSIGEQSSNSSGKQVEHVRRMTAANGRHGFISSSTRTTRTTGKSVIADGGRSDQDEVEDVEEKPLVRHRTRHTASKAADEQVVSSPESSPPRLQQGRHQPNGDAFPSEWGGISSEEHDEAVMLEAAMFGGIPEGSSYNYTYPPHVLQHGSDRNSNMYPWVPRPPSPTLTAQRLLKEQQDDEYLAALQADREKELKATQEAAAAREATLEKERFQKEEARRKVIEGEEFERNLAAKQASLPQEPSSDDENAVSLLIRMPDGSRCGRRFLKSDKLQFLFDYIDVGRVVKPGTYRLVRPYPRQTFADGESISTLSELGLTSKQEALFLELI